MIRAGIVGGAGYVGGELIRLLLIHPEVELEFVQSSSQADKKISDVHTDLIGETDIKFTSDWKPTVDVIFLSMGHGESKKFLGDNSIPETIKIIDMSQDFRIESENSESFIYGLPETNRDKIKQAGKIANPGCFATAIQLGLLPLAKSGELQDDVHVNAITGSTGAGQGLKFSSHFSWRESNISVYKPFRHQHLAEINQTISGLQLNWNHQIHFLPVRGNFTRGIFATLYVNTELTGDDCRDLYEKYFESHPFVIFSDKNPDLKQVINTNKCILYVEKIGDHLLIISIIDNLIKGAAGQAVQNMNLMFGLEESTGLRLKPSAF
jgi:N-acetyl-gamma-glutamyl-phosphate reductase